MLTSKHSDYLLSRKSSLRAVGLQDGPDDSAGVTYGGANTGYLFGMAHPLRQQSDSLFVMMQMMQMQYTVIRNG